MANPGKNPAPLLEIIRNAGQGKLALPGWARRRSDGTDAAEPSAPASGSVEATPMATAEASRRGIVAWFGTPSTLRITRGAMVAGIAGVAALVIGAGWVGQRVGYRAGLGVQKSEDAALAELGQIRREPNPALLPSTIEGVGSLASKNPAGPGPAVVARAAPTGASDPPASRTGLEGGNPDPRQPGLNYYRLTLLPARSAAEAERILAFLEKSGVDAAIIPIQNGRSLKVIALPGYAHPISDPQARAFEQKLKSLGRQWRTQQRGSSDWKDLFPEKYLPGRN